MSKIPEYVNVAKNIKKYIMLKKLEKYSKNTTKPMWINIVDILIVGMIIAALYYVCFISTGRNFKVSTAVLALGFMIFYIVKISIYVVSDENKYTGITKLVLMDEEGINMNEWELKGKKSLLIGKYSKNNEVDIDLSSAEYASLISKQHAVLNFAANNWYIEDIGSCNGVGIKKGNDILKKKIQKDSPYKLDSGDIIYIANTKLFIE